MTAVERKIVHELLKDDPEVETASEGTEPNRFVVVLPRRLRRLSGRASSCAILDRWLAAVVATPGLTALRDPADARARCCSTTRSRGAELVAADGRPDRRRRLGRRHARDPARRRAARARGDAARGRAPQVRLPRALGGGAPEPPRRLGPRRGAAARDVRRRASRRRSRSRRSPPSGACRSSARAARSSSGSGRSADPARRRAVAERGRRRARGVARRACS